MKTTILVLSALTLAACVPNGFGETSGRASQQGRALSTGLKYLFPALSTDVVDKSMRFWTVPETSKDANLEVVQDGDSQTVLSYLSESRRLRVDFLTSGRLMGSVVIEPGPLGDFVAHDGKGRILLSARTENGIVSLIGNQGRLVARVVPAYRPPPAAWSPLRAWRGLGVAR